MRPGTFLTFASLVVVGCGGSDPPSIEIEQQDDGAVADTGSTGAGDTSTASETAGGDAPAIDDSAPSDTPVDSGCTLSFYKDEDGDGVGGTTKVLACTAPAGHVTSTGDCRDDKNDVRPGSMEYRTVGYTNTAPISPTSFDYNCDGTEQRDPTKAIAGDCVVSGLGCMGDGYLPTSTTRTGTGVDNRCGSTRFRKCERRTVPPSCTATEIVAPTPMGCR